MSAIPQPAANVLLLTNLFPTTRSAAAGVFIEHRLRAWPETALPAPTPYGLHPVPARYLAPLRRVFASRSGETRGRHFVETRVPTGLGDAVRFRLGRYPSRKLIKRAADAVIARLGDEKVDVVHAHGMYLIPAGAVAQELSTRLGVPFLVSVHGSDINHFMRSRSVEYASVLSRAANVIYVSAALRDRAVELGAPKHNAVIIPNGVDTTTFAPPATGVERGGMCFVGNLEEVKGADRLPDIFRRFLGEMPESNLVVCGDGSLRRRLEQDMAGLPVTFEGSVPSTRVAEVMGRAQLAVLPSRSEGWPCVVLEAHACETPILVADAGGAAEAVGNPKWVVPQGPDFERRFAALASALLRQEAHSGFRQRALKYDWREITRREYELLQHATGGPAR